jgi:hypothetical protein
MSTTILFMEIEIMKLSILILAAVFSLVPLTASADPDTQTAFLTDYNQNIIQEDTELYNSTEDSSQPSVREHRTARIQEYVYEVEFEKLKVENLEETREAVAEDLILN